MDDAFPPPEISPTNHTVEDTEDGGAIVKIDIKTPKDNKDTRYYANLYANPKYKKDIEKLASAVFEKVKKDRKNREAQDKKHADNLKRTGLDQDVIGGATWEGAADVVHPALLEAGIDYSARVIQEHFPMTGPVRPRTVGPLTDAKAARSIRVVNWLNHQLTEVCRDFRDEIEKGVAQQPYAGAYYMKPIWTEDSDRPIFEHISMDNIILPSSASSFATAHRKTHRYSLTEDAFLDRVESGMFVDDDKIIPSQPDEKTAPEESAARISGQEDDPENIDGTSYKYDVYLHQRIPFISKKNTFYVLSIDAQDGRPHALYRNSEEGKPNREVEQIVEFPFLRIRGAYASSLGDVLSGIQSAATGALRALLDTAHIQNHPGQVRLKGGGVAAKSYNIHPTAVVEIEAANSDDIRKVVMPNPTVQPSPILFQLLGFLTDLARGVVRTSMEDTTNSNTPTPVGTQMSRVEEGTRTFKSIFQRQFVAMSRLLKIVFRLNQENLTDEIIKDQAGEVLAKAEDFRGPCDILPTADPNIYTEAQRFSQTQGIAARATGNPLYNAVEVEKRVLRQLRVPEEEIEQLLVQPPKPKEMNAVNENMSMMLGQPIVAFPMQHHLAHIQTHLAFLEDPNFGSSPIAVAKFTPAMLEHLKQHVAFWYVIEVVRIVEGEGFEIAEMMKQEDPKVKAQMDVLFAMASTRVHETAAKSLAQIPPTIQKAIQLLSQYAPKPPMDPGQVQIEDIKAKVKIKEMDLQDNDKDRAQRGNLQSEELRQKQQEFEARIAMQVQEMKDAMEASRMSTLAELKARLEEDMRQHRLDAAKVAADLHKNSVDNATTVQVALIGREDKTKTETGETVTASEIPAGVEEAVASAVIEGVSQPPDLP